MKSFSRVLQPKGRWVLLLLAGVVLLAACSSSAPVTGEEQGRVSDELEAAEGNGSSIPCDQSLAVESLDSRSVCVTSIGSHDAVVLPAYDLTSREVIIIDPGGPVLELDEIVEIVAAVESAQSGHLDATYLALAPKNTRLPDSCRSAEGYLLPESCDLSSVSQTHFDGYADDILTATNWFGSEATFHLLASSFGAARWESILLRYDSISIESAVFMSPLSGGIGVSEYQDGLTDAARVIFQRIVDGCIEPHCFESFGDPIDPDSCPGFTCRPEDSLAAVAGMTSDDVLLGMYGLMPVADINAKTIFEVFDSGNSDQMRKLLEQGQASFLGLNAFGEISDSHLELVAAACSVMKDDSLEYSGVFPECALIDVRPEFQSSLEFHSEPELPDTCYYSPQPDPVLGYASTVGDRIGNSMFSYTEPLQSFSHGDLELGASRLVELIETDKCPMNFTE